MLETQIGLMYARARTRTRLVDARVPRSAGWRRAGRALRGLAGRLGRP
jgi:hypothetical protein